MLTIGPSIIILLLILGFVLWIKFIKNDKQSVKVIKEEQLYNRDEEKQKEILAKKAQRDSVRREERSEIRIEKKEEEDRDYGIV